MSQGINFKIYDPLAQFIAGGGVAPGSIPGSAIQAGTITNTQLAPGAAIANINAGPPGTINPSQIAPGLLPLAGGTLTGNLTMNGTAQIIQCTLPTTPCSLANKQYVDSAIANITLSIPNSLTSGSNSIISNVGGNISTLAPLTGTIFQSIGFDSSGALVKAVGSSSITNLLTGGNNNISSNVSGTVSNLAIGTNPMCQVVGLDSSGNLVRANVNAVPVSNSLTSNANSLVSNVGGNASTVTIGTNPMCQIVGLDSNGNLVRANVNAVPVSNSLTGTSNNISSNVAGNVSNLAIGTTPMCQIVGLDSSGNLVRANVNAVPVSNSLTGTSNNISSNVAGNVSNLAIGTTPMCQVVGLDSSGNLVRANVNAVPITNLLTGTSNNISSNVAGNVSNLAIGTTPMCQVVGLDSSGNLVRANVNAVPITNSLTIANNNISSNVSGNVSNLAIGTNPLCQVVGLDASGNLVRGSFASVITNSLTGSSNTLISNVGGNVSALAPPVGNITQALGFDSSGALVIDPSAPTTNLLTSGGNNISSNVSGNVSNLAIGTTPMCQVVGLDSSGNLVRANVNAVPITNLLTGTSNNISSNVAGNVSNLAIGTTPMCQVVGLDSSGNLVRTNVNAVPITNSLTGTNNNISSNVSGNVSNLAIGTNPLCQVVGLDASGNLVRGSFASAITNSLTGSSNTFISNVGGNVSALAPPVGNITQALGFDSSGALVIDPSAPTTNLLTSGGNNISSNVSGNVSNLAIGTNPMCQVMGLDSSGQLVRANVNAVPITNSLTIANNNISSNVAGNVSNLTIGTNPICQVVGLDASGNLVRGSFASVITNSLTGSSNTLISNVGGNVSALAPPVGNITQALGFDSSGALVIDPSAPTTNLLTSGGNNISSNVSGNVSNLAIGTTPMCQVVGLDSSGNLVRANVNAVPITNLLTGTSNNISSNVAGNVSNLAIGTTPMCQVVGLDSSGNLVRTNVNAVPITNSLTIANNNISSNVAGNVSNLTIGTNPICQVVGLDASGNLVRGSFTSVITNSLTGSSNTLISNVGGNVSALAPPVGNITQALGFDSSGALVIDPSAPTTNLLTSGGNNISSNVSGNVSNLAIGTNPMCQVMGLDSSGQLVRTNVNAVPITNTLTGTNNNISSNVSGNVSNLAIGTNPMCQVMGLDSSGQLVRANVNAVPITNTLTGTNNNISSNVSGNVSNLAIGTNPMCQVMGLDSSGQLVRTSVNAVPIANSLSGTNNNISSNVAGNVSNLAIGITPMCQVVGLDANGNLVRSNVNAVPITNSLTSSTNAFVSNVAGNVSTLVPAAGTIAKTLGFDITGALVTAGSVPTTNSLTSANNNISSNVSGNVSNLAIGTNPICQVVGLDASGSLVRGSVNTVVTNSLTGVANTIISNVSGNVSTLAPATGSATKMLGFDSNGLLITDSNVAKKVNGVLPDSNGNIAVALGNVSTGVLSALPFTAVESDVYVVSGDPTSTNNGRAFIYDSAISGWLEITGNLATTDARYFKRSSDSLNTGSVLTIPSTSKITIIDPAVNPTDAMNLQTFTTRNAGLSQFGTVEFAPSGDLVDAGPGVNTGIAVVKNLAIGTSKLNLSAPSRIFGSTNLTNAVQELTIGNGLQITSSGILQTNLGVGVITNSLTGGNNNIISNVSGNVSNLAIGITPMCQVVGLDASGNLVRANVSAVPITNSLTGSSNSLVSNVAGNVSTLTPVTGTISKSLGFDSTGALVTAGSTPATNALTSSANNISSNVSGNVSNIVIGINPLCQVVGLDASGALVRGGVSAVVTNSLTGSANALISNVAGNVSTLTPASGTIAKTLGFDSAGALVIAGSTPTTNALTSGANNISSNVSGNVSNLAIGTNPLCQVVGLDASGALVRGGVSAVVTNSLTGSANTLISNVAGNVSTLTPASGTIAKSLGFDSAGALVIAGSTPTTNALTIANNNISSNVSGNVSNLAIGTNPICQVVGLDASGNLARGSFTSVITNSLTGSSNTLISNVGGNVSALAPPVGNITQALGFDSSGALVIDPSAPTTNLLTSGGNNISSNVSGNVSNLAIGTNPMCQVMGLDSSGQLVRVNVNAVPITNTLTGTNNNISSNVSGNVSNLAIGTNPMCQVVGLDASGALVRGGVSAVVTNSFTGSANALISNVAGNVSTLTPASGTIAKTLGFDSAGALVIAGSTPTTNALTSGANNISSNVSGNVSNLTIGTTPMCQVVGLDASGNLVRTNVNAVPITNTLTGTNNNISSNVSGNVSNLAIGTNPMCQVMGLDSSGQLVRVNVNAVPITNTLTGTNNNISSNVSGNVSNLAIGTNPMCQVMGLDSSGQLVRANVNAVPITNSLTGSANALISNVAGNVSTLTPASGTIAKTLGFDSAGALVIAGSTPTTNALTSGANNISSNVSGNVSNLAIGTNPLCQVVGLDASGQLVRVNVNAVPITNTLTGTNNNISSNVSGNVSNLAIGTNPMCQVMGLDSSGQLVRANVNAVPITNSLTGSANALISNVAGNVSTLTPASGTIAKSLGFDSAGALVIAGSTPTTNNLTSSANAFVSNVNGVVSSLTPAPGTINQFVGFNSGGTLVVSDTAATAFSKAGASQFGIVEFEPTVGDLVATSINSGIGVVGPNKITYSKIQQAAPGVIMGTPSNNSNLGNFEPLTLGPSMSLTGVNGSPDTGSVLNSALSFITGGPNPNSVAPTDRPQKTNVAYIGNNGSVWVWRPSLNSYVTTSQPGVSGFLKQTSFFSIPIRSTTPAILTDYSITIPPGQTLRADYIFRYQNGNAIGTGIDNVAAAWDFQGVNLNDIFCGYTKFICGNPSADTPETTVSFNTENAGTFTIVNAGIPGSHTPSFYMGSNSPLKFMNCFGHVEYVNKSLVPSTITPRISREPYGGGTGLDYGIYVIGGSVAYSLYA